MKLSGAEYLRVSQLNTAVENRSGLPNLGRIATAPARRTAVITTTLGRDDDATASADLMEARRVSAQIAGEMDVREDVVASLREQIASGAYQVSGEQIAEMLVRRLLADRMR